jgi:hypothetical protein
LIECATEPADVVDADALTMAARAFPDARETEARAERITDVVGP